MLEADLNEDDGIVRVASVMVADDVPLVLKKNIWTPTPLVVRTLTPINAYFTDS